MSTESIEDDFQPADRMTESTRVGEFSPATTLPPEGPPKPPLSKDHQKLASAYPSATEQEVYRFLNANKGNLKKAGKHMQTYLEWRNAFHLDDPPPEDFHPSSSVTQDENDWNSASFAALSLDKSLSDFKSLPNLPRLVRMDDVDGNPEMRDRSGHRIIQLNPAMVDLTLASEVTYANCVAFYFDRRFSRTSLEKITLSVDIRGGDGWACPSAQQIIPFIKEVFKVMDRNFPDRLHCSLVWPMPWAAEMLWKMVKVFLDPQTVERVKVLNAPGERDSPPPYDQMDKYIEKSVVERTEKNRTSTIVPEK